MPGKLQFGEVEVRREEKTDDGKKWRGGRLEDGDIKMIISLYKAVNYKVIIN
jgi:hypothetical protein